MTDQLTRPASPPPSVAGVVWKRHVTDVHDRVEAESEAYRAVTPRRVVVRKVAVITVATAISLTLIRFLNDGDQPQWALTLLRGVGLDGMATRLEGALLTSDHRAFNQLVFWALVQIGGYVIVPVIAVKIILRERLGGYGLAFRGIWRQGGTYVFLLAAVLPLVIAASFTGPFQAKYPYYDLAAGEGLWPLMWGWWLFYAAQFVALEFFFRGFMVHGLRWRFGYAAIFAMIIPYNMIHFGKPMLEALGAIGGGVVLGSLSLKTNSIWWGAALHIAVAGTMDVLALTHAGLLF